MWSRTSACGTTLSLAVFPTRRRIIVVNFVAGLILGAAFFRQASAEEYFLDQAHIQYVSPTNPAHLLVYNELSQARALENIQKMLPPVRLPRPLLLKLQSCGGADDDAWYDDGIVTVCYDFFEEMLAIRLKLIPPLNLKREEALIAFATNTFLHEIGHAIFSLLKVPVLGREEDAADTFAAYIALHYGSKNARKLILGYAYQYKAAQQTEEGEPLLEKLSDEHGMAAQRFFNVLCLAYGADQKLFVDLVDKGQLPKDRAESCGEEYEQAAFAFRALFGLDDAIEGSERKSILTVGGVCGDHEQNAYASGQAALPDIGFKRMSAPRKDVSQLRKIGSDDRSPTGFLPVLKRSTRRHNLHSGAP